MHSETNNVGCFKLSINFFSHSLRLFNTPLLKKRLFNTPTGRPSTFIDQTNTKEMRLLSTTYFVELVKTL